MITIVITHHHFVEDGVTVVKKKYQGVIVISLRDLKPYVFMTVIIPQDKHVRKVILTMVIEKILQQAVNHSKLEYLEIGFIHNFKSLCGVFQHLSTLSELCIENCEEFDPCNDEDGCYNMKWKELKNLKVLEFIEFPKMKYLPEGLQHIRTLQTLRIVHCDSLTSVPEWVTSLQVFDIKGCPNVTFRHLGVQGQLRYG